MEIKLIRLTSGEEVIAEIVEEKTSSIKFKKPLVLYAAEENQIGFMPYIPYTKADEGLTIKNRHVLFTVDPIEDIIRQYKELTGDIIIPETGEVIV